MNVMPIRFFGLPVQSRHAAIRCNVRFQSSVRFIGPGLFSLTKEDFFSLSRVLHSSNPFSFTDRCHLLFLNFKAPYIPVKNAKALTLAFYFLLLSYRRVGNQNQRLDFCLGYRAFSQKDLLSGIFPLPKEGLIDTKIKYPRRDERPGSLITLKP